MYTEINFKTKKQLIEAVKAGRTVRVFQPNGDLTGFNTGPKTGRVAIEGPHYPEPHRWYASAEVVDNVIVKVK